MMMMEASDVTDPKLVSAIESLEDKAAKHSGAI